MKYKTMLTVVVIIAIIIPALSKAYEYEIGPEDVLEISFWQQPDLNVSVTVRQDGNISVPVVGEITAAGLTTKKLAANIVEKMVYYNPNINQATVVVNEFNSHKVYITGQVANPGRLTFERFPNMWDAIKEAGGPTEEADLSRVRFIRGKSGKMEIINLREILENGEINKIPILANNDNVDIPRFPLSVGNEGISYDYGVDGLFFVYGAVNSPGALGFSEGLDVLDGIVLAGGPSEDAKLSDVRLIRKIGDYGEITKLNLDKYTSVGRPKRIPLKPGDTIVIPEKKSFWGSFLSTVRDVIPAAAAATTTIIAILIYNNRN